MTEDPYWAGRLGELAERSGVPGAALGIWAGGAEILASHGVLNVATGVRVTTGSLFQIGSITKPWTATMIMQLAEEGRLGLDQPVSGLLPGTPLGSPDRSGRITVRQLLTHTCGIDGDVFTDTGRGSGCVRRYVDGLACSPFVTEPGGTFSYCNAGFVLLGRIIEVLDGRVWDESLRTRLIEPLGLTQTVTLPEEAILHRAAVGSDKDGAVQVWGLPRGVGPAGLIVASARDVLAFARLHLGGGIAPSGTRVLAAESVAAMQQPQALIPVFSEPGAASGLSWRVHPWRAGDGSRRMVFGHDGMTVGQTSYLRIDPVSGVAACLLTNASLSGALFEELFREVFARYADIAPPGTPAPADVAVDARRHAGRYERISSRLDVSPRDGGLHLTMTATGALDRGGDPESMDLYPADPSGDNFVFRERDDEPWTPASFGTLADGTPYVYISRRITPRAG